MITLEITKCVFTFQSLPLIFLACPPPNTKTLEGFKSIYLPPALLLLFAIIMYFNIPLICYKPCKTLLLLL